MASESFEQTTQNIELNTSNMTTQSMSGTSGLSSLDMNTSIGDKFEGTLYHVLPSVSKVNIKFSIPVLFSGFMQLLEKELVSPKWTVENKFSVSSHIHGRKVTITVFESENTIEVTGPGHKLWKDIAFRRLSTTLFTRFLQNCGIDLHSSTSNSVNNMTFPPQMASTPVISRAVLASGPVVPTPELVNTSSDPVEAQVPIRPQMFNTPVSSRPGQTSVPVMPTPEPTTMNQGPVESQMSSVLEALAYHSRMISSLQDQLTTLTSELVKLQERATLTQGNPVKKSAETLSANVLHRTISVSSINSSASEQPSSLPQMTLESVSKNEADSKSVRHKTKSKKGNKSQAANVQSQSRHYIPRIQPSKTLIIGDSIIKGINEKGLKHNVLCHGISGATLQTVAEQVQLYDLQNFSTVILSVGGNDLANSRDPEYIEERFDQLFVQIRNRNPDCKIIVCTICPRTDCTVNELNTLLSSLCGEHGIQIVDMENFFCNVDGHPILRYYKTDKIHLSRSGIRRLLDSIEKTCSNTSLVDNYEHCAFGRAVGKQNTHGPSPQSGFKDQDQRSGWQRPQHRVQQRNQRRIQLSGQNRTQNCVKCGESNHSTFDCKHKEQIMCHSCGFYGHKQLRCPNQ